MGVLAIRADLDDLTVPYVDNESAQRFAQPAEGGVRPVLTRPRDHLRLLVVDVTLFRNCNTIPMG
jgi:hypothetical protein